MTTIWLLVQQQAIELERARAKHVLTGEQIEAFERSASSASTIARNAGDTAEIGVIGVLTKSRDRLAWFMGIGNTTYADIRSALAAAVSDPSIKKIVLRIDSPGGQVDGLFETIDAIAACPKPIRAVCDFACSAAYGIASACKRIEATGRAAAFGSIGVATSYSFSKSQTVVELTNTDAPNKRPDVRTDAGRAVVVQQLDDVAALFIDAIAKGRRVSASTVKANYGRGGVLLTAAALKAGMIDGVLDTPSTSTRKPSRAAALGVAGLLGEPAPGGALAFVEGQLLPLMKRPASPSTPDLGDQIVALLPAR